jgi:hypothetical protein
MNALVKPLTGLLGIVLLAVGVLGFFNDPILGLFDVNTLHNIVHIASGILGLAAAGSGYGMSRTYLIVFGLVYAVVALLGFINLAVAVSLLELNPMDNYLHMAIAAVCLVVGFGSSRNA